MKKIGVISDTHITGYDAGLELLVMRHFSDADLIVHAGDLVTMDVLDVFSALGREVAAVCGNMDSLEIRKILPEKRIITVEDVRIGVIHGWGSPHGIRDRIKHSFENVDAIIYGHSHQAFAGTESGTYFFNPGSPTDSRFTSRRSIGIMQVEGNTIRGEVVWL
ncbi:MAG: metallophosphoesterase [Desulfomonilia bacterium]|jgi:putative phosphoesterase